MRGVGPEHDRGDPDHTARDGSERGHDDDAPPTTTTPAPDEPGTDAPPGTFEEVMARLPPFDVPPSPEVTAYREAALGGFFERCVESKGADVERVFVRANVELLDRVPVFARATFATEYSADHRDGNSCPEGMGPPTSYSTSRTYRLPAGVGAEAVVRFYERALAGWGRSFAATPGRCEQTFSRREQLLAVRACGNGLVLTARALAPREPPAAPKLPPRPYGAQYPIAANYLDAPEPTAYETEPGETCERTSAEGVPSIILPPPPGVRAEIRGKHVVVEWSLGTVHGDCPPSQLILSYPAVTAFTIHEDAHAASGVTRMMLLDFVPPPKHLSAVAVSVDGHQSRRVAVLVRRG